MLVLYTTLHVEEGILMLQIYFLHSAIYILPLSQPRDLYGCVGVTPHIPTHGQSNVVYVVIYI